MLTVCRGKKFRDVSWAELNAMPLQVPERTAGPTWCPVRHADLLRELAHAVEDLGYVITSDRLAVSRTGFDLIGGFSLRSGPDSSYAPAVYVRHDNRQGRALEIGCGARVFVCDNGMVSALWQHRRRHTRGLDLPGFCREAVAGLRGRFEIQAQQIELARSETMPAPGDRLLELASSGALTPAVAAAAWEHYRNPPHREFRDGGSRWCWYNAVTEGAKRLAPERQVAALGAAWHAALN